MKLLMICGLAAVLAACSAHQSAQCASAASAASALPDAAATRTRAALAPSKPGRTCEDSRKSASQAGRCDCTDQERMKARVPADQAAI